MAENKKESGCCPLCGPEIQGADLPFCKPCNVTRFYCPSCRQQVRREETACPKCSAEIKITEG